MDAYVWFRKFCTRNRGSLYARCLCIGLCAACVVFAAGELPLERKETVNNRIAKAMLKAEVSMRFKGETNEQFLLWQDRFRSQLNVLLGDSHPPKTWKVIHQERTKQSDHTRYALFLETEENLSLPVYLLVSNGLKKDERAPGVICVHGHGPFGHDAVVGRSDREGIRENIAAHDYDYGLQFVRRGYVVVAPCMIPFGRRVDVEHYGGNDPCAVTFVRRQALGQLPITSNLRDLRWSIDFLQSQPQVAPDRIGCAGLSYGGRMTMMLAAVDQRVKVAAVSGALNLLQERLTSRHSCGSQVIPGLLKWGDYSEIGSLIAPRPCVWETGSKDPLIVDPWAELFRNRLRHAYRLSEAKDDLLFDEFHGGHRWNGSVAYTLFDQVLRKR